MYVCVCMWKFPYLFKMYVQVYIGKLKQELISLIYVILAQLCVCGQCRNMN